MTLTNKLNTYKTLTISVFNEQDIDKARIMLLYGLCDAIDSYCSHQDLKQKVYLHVEQTKGRLAIVAAVKDKEIFAMARAIEIISGSTCCCCGQTKELFMLVELRGLTICSKCLVMDERFHRYSPYHKKINAAQAKTAILTFLSYSGNIHLRNILLKAFETL